MNLFDMLEDEIQSLRVMKTVDPQDKKRICSLVTQIEELNLQKEYPNSWLEFKEMLEQTLEIRDTENTKELLYQFYKAQEDLEK